ncbi:MAG: amidohydrolase family protein [Treponema sp.]|uniref:amidohydrolase family protein n=1 Tax=Treponema sp. TaxID=166 RepID=UPI0025CED247|nr:amidohydrolase family protein [Treponema sp.]MBQ9280626.1 amidohydrolase family protein [Treponema sp.]
MTDYHIHIGQFNEIYYDAIELFDIIESTQNLTHITEIRYSSTSSCRDDAELSLVEEEIAYAQSFESKNLIIKPYLWFIPKYAEQGISVKSATKSFDYCGIKLHPAGQIWDEENPMHFKALHQIFRWADDNKKSVLIHCGTQKCDLPTRFEPFFAEYRHARVILAHSNPVGQTAEMLNKYKNVFSDTACLEKKNLQKLRALTNDKSKILFGSDFPVSHYFATLLFGERLSLKDEYLKNCKF